MVRMEGCGGCGALIKPSARIPGRHQAASGAYLRLVTESLPYYRQFSLNVRPFNSSILFSRGKHRDFSHQSKIASMPSSNAAVTPWLWRRQYPGRRQQEAEVGPI